LSYISLDLIFRNVTDITLPVDLSAGTYTLRVFNEQINGDNVTDFASPPVDISLTVDALPAVAALTPQSNPGFFKPMIAFLC